MNIKQRELISSLQEKSRMLQSFTKQLSRDLEALNETCTVKVRREYTDKEIENLVVLNQRLIGIESYLKKESEAECQLLRIRVANENDLIYDYEIDVTMNYVLREDDPEFDPDDDNILTTRNFSVKRLDREQDPEREWGVGDNQNHHDPCINYPGVLNEVRHCYLFHDLYDHSYNLEMISLSWEQCLRVGEIWIDVEVKKQVSLNVDTGEARYKV